MGRHPFDIFLDPPKEASPLPMWFWNDHIDPDGIRERLRDFHDKEVYGFVLHPRMGLPAEIPYLSDLFLDLAEVAVEEAERLGMRVILYDEGMYPSGSAHGEVVRADPSFASQCLTMRLFGAEVGQAGGVRAPASLPMPSAGVLVSLQVLRVDLSSGGFTCLEALPLPDDRRFDAAALLAGSAALPTGCVFAAFVQEPSGGRIRGVHPGEDSREPGAPLAADLMNPSAVDRFIALTHERYYGRLARFFGGTLFAMFTDEPSLLGRGDMTGRIPWTTGFLKECLAAGIAETDLCGLFDDTASTSGLRRRFERTCRGRLEETFFRKTSRWCSTHGIALTGHPAEPDALSPQRWFGIPGQDLVLRRVAPEGGKSLEGPESTLAKGVADAARHRGLRRCAAECFGCCVRTAPGTGWHLPMEDLKWYVDWLSVRGVDLLIPHAFYYSIRGDRGRERPPDVGPNNLWWQDFATCARYMRRLSWLLLDARDPSAVAVLCTGDRLPFRVPRKLYENQVGFCYLEEDLLLDGTCRLEGDRVVCAGQSYALLLVEDSEELAPETLRILADLRENGYPVIEAADENVGGGHWLDLAIALSGEKTLSHQPGLRIRRMEKDGWRYLLCVNEGETPVETELELDSVGPVELWDPWTGQRERLTTSRAVGDGSGEQGGTIFRLDLGYRESRILAIPPPTDGEDGPDSMDSDGVEMSFSTGAAPRSDDSAPVARILEGAWTVRFEDEGEWRSIGDLTDWRDLRPGSFHSGTARYRVTFDAASDLSSAARCLLDLGAVEESAAVWLNGEEVGRRYWKPFRFDLTRFVVPGTNLLEIEATNSISCRMDHALLPSGLLGPVVLSHHPSPHPEVES